MAEWQQLVRLCVRANRRVVDARRAHDRSARLRYILHLPLGTRDAPNARVRVQQVDGGVAAIIEHAIEREDVVL